MDIVQEFPFDELCDIVADDITNIRQDSYFAVNVCLILINLIFFQMLFDSTD